MTSQPIKSSDLAFRALVLEGVHPLPLLVQVVLDEHRRKRNRSWGTRRIDEGTIAFYPEAPKPLSRVKNSRIIGNGCKDLACVSYIYWGNQTFKIRTRGPPLLNNPTFIDLSSVYIRSTCRVDG